MKFNKIDLVIGLCIFGITFILMLSNKNKVFTLFGKIAILFIERWFPNGINFTFSKGAVNNITFLLSLILSFFAAIIIIVFAHQFLPRIYEQQKENKCEESFSRWPDGLSAKEPIGTRLWEIILSKCVKAGSKKFRAKLEPIPNSKTSHLVIKVCKNGLEEPLMSVPYESSNSFFLVGRFLSSNKDKTFPYCIWSLFGINYHLEVTFPNGSSNELVAELKEVP